MESIIDLFDDEPSVNSEGLEEGDNGLQSEEPSNVEE